VRAGAATATATAPNVVVPTGVDLERVRERWEDFTLALRDSKAALAHCLSEGRPVRLHGITLEVYFPPEHSFHLNLFQEAVRKRELEPYLATYFGQPLQVALSSAAEPSPEPAPAPPPTPAGRLTPDDIARSRRGALSDVLKSTPGLEAIIDAFDGEVLEDPGA
jgi:hypothetical protein